MAQWLRTQTTADLSGDGKDGSVVGSTDNCGPEWGHH